MSAIELIEDERAERTGALSTGSLVAAARTHKGAVRADNQDAFVCDPAAGLFAVIDGMGGERGGRRAAELARLALREQADPAEGLMAANARIYEAASTDRELEGMGCVASAVRVGDGVARIAHVGDTRVYMAGSAGCEQLTRDHTLAASIQEKLGLSHRRARALGGRNQVTRDVGGRPRRGQRWIDRLEVPLEQGALLLLCSDGLYDTVGADALFGLLRRAHREESPLEGLVDELVELALERGAPDNVTAVVVRQEGQVPEAAVVRRDRERRVTVSVAIARAAHPLLLFLLGLTMGFALRGWLW